MLLLALCVQWAVIPPAHGQGRCQFEEYAWGVPEAEAFTAVRQRHADAAALLPGIGFRHTLLGEECVVLLLFTPKTRLLAGVALRWESAAVIDKAALWLTQQYGPPLDASERGKKYEWGESRYDTASAYRIIGESAGAVILERIGNETHLAYYYGPFWNQLMREQDEIR